MLRFLCVKSLSTAGIHCRVRGCPGERTGAPISCAQYPGRRTGHGGPGGEVALLLRNAGSLGPSMLDRDNPRGTLQQHKGVSLQWKVVELLAKMMREMTATTGMCGRGGKEVFVGVKGIGVSDVVAKHIVVMV